jgi:hypothetical protein
MAAALSRAVRGRGRSVARLSLPRNGLPCSSSGCFSIAFSKMAALGAREVTGALASANSIRRTPPGCGGPGPNGKNTHPSQERGVLPLVTYPESRFLWRVFREPAPWAAGTPLLRGETGSPRRFTTALLPAAWRRGVRGRGVDTEPCRVAIQASGAGARTGRQVDQRR